MSIFEAWDSMVLIEKIYWCIAILFSLLFVIQLILTFFGGDMDAIEVDGGSFFSTKYDIGIDFQFLSVKNMIAFFVLFGWVGIAGINAGLAAWVTILLAAVCGLIVMLVMATIIYFVGKLTVTGTIKLKNIVGLSASVYFTIPAKRGGIGKIQIELKEQQIFDALTDHGEDIKTGTVVDVVDVVNGELLLVRPSGELGSSF